MENFEFTNPTKVVFGKNQFDKIGELLKENNATRVMIAYGGGSIKKTGVYDKVISALKDDFHLVEFGGIEPNPEFNTLMKAAKIVRNESVDFILAVGGGSVIDGVKFISGASNYDGDPWEVMEKKEGYEFTEAIPFGTVLTLPATGSEVNSGAVVSRKEIQAKRVMGGPKFFPKFSICDPTVVSTLPKRQLANGIIDAYVHTLEQYLTLPTNNLLQEREAEAILSTLIEIRDVVNNPSNYKLASNFMLCASHALNGNLRCGVPTDWATHMIGHELTAHFGIDHAQTLAIICPRLYEHEFDKKKEKLIQYGQRVFKLVGNDDLTAREAIKKTEEFFHSLGVKTRISEYTEDYNGIDQIIMETFVERDWTEMGETKSINPQDVREIVHASY